MNQIFSISVPFAIATEVLGYTRRDLYYRLDALGLKGISRNHKRLFSVPEMFLLLLIQRLEMYGMAIVDAAEVARDAIQPYDALWKAPSDQPEAKLANILAAMSAVALVVSWSGEEYVIEILEAGEDGVRIGPGYPHAIMVRLEDVSLRVGEILAERRADLVEVASDRPNHKTEMGEVHS